MKAFPNSSPFNTKEDGMDLRDYFAAKAMQALIIEGKEKSLKIACQIAWGVADVMMRERKEFNDLL